MLTQLIDYFFDIENYFVAGIQIFGYFSLLYYLVASIKVFRIGLSKEHKEQGSLPVLPFIYLLFSVFFIGIFIKSYEDIYLANKISLLNASNFFSDINSIAPIFNFSILSLLVAFTLNFSKSFYTLNSLEFGILTVKDYGEKLYAGNGKKRVIIIDTILKTIIAFIFVFLEHTLSESSHLFKDKELSAFIKIGSLALALYTSTIIWFFYNVRIDNKNKSRQINNWWYWNSLFQFFAGFSISISLVIIGFIHNSDAYGTWGLVLAGLIVLFSFIILVTIILNEFKPKKYYNASS